MRKRKDEPLNEYTGRAGKVLEIARKKTIYEDEKPFSLKNFADEMGISVNKAWRMEKGLCKFELGFWDEARQLLHPHLPKIGEFIPEDKADMCVELKVKGVIATRRTLDKEERSKKVEAQQPAQEARHA